MTSEPHVPSETAHVLFSQRASRPVTSNDFCHCLVKAGLAVAG